MIVAPEDGTRGNVTVVDKSLENMDEVYRQFMNSFDGNDSTDAVVEETEIYEAAADSADIAEPAWD